MFKADVKQTQRSNKSVYETLKTAVEQYRAELDNYSDRVVLKILERMAKEEKYHIKGKFGDEIGNLLMHPPELRDMSLPVFLGQTDEEGNHYEICNLKYGYLFIYLDKDCWIAQAHISHDTQYLDVKKTLKQTIPAIIRDTATVTTPVYQLVKFARLFI